MGKVTIVACGCKRIKAKFRTLKVVPRSKNTLTFSSDFKTLFPKHSPNKILGLNFEKTVYLNYNFLIQWSTIIRLERINYNDIIYLECSV